MRRVESMVASIGVGRPGASAVASSVAAVVAWCAVVSSASGPARSGIQGSLPGQLRRPELKELATGKLLVAARGLPDPNFAESIVLLADFSSKGALGIIVNRQTDATLERIAPGLEQPRGRPTLLFFGGPVQVPGVLALVRASRAPDDTRHVFADVYLVNTREALEKVIAEGTDPARLRIYVGYAGWAADQLNTETARGAWHVLEGDSDVVFDRDPGSAWERQVRRSEALQADRRTDAKAGGRAL